MLLVMDKAICEVILLWHQLMIVKIVKSFSRVISYILLIVITMVFLYYFILF